MTGYSARIWIKHIFSARGLRQVHSPWLYAMYYSMRHPKSLKDSRIVMLAFIRGDLLDDKSKLEFNELGSREGLIKSTVSKVFRRTAKPLKQAEVLAELAARCNGKTILEMGTAFGTTTLAMHFAAPKSRIITMEGVEEIATIAKNNFEKHQANNIEIHIGKFCEVLPKIVATEREVNIVFIDGHHSRIPTLKYIEKLLPALSETAIVVVDDIYYSRDMGNCWNELLKHPAFQVKVDFFHFGLLIRNPDLSADNLRLRL